MTKNEDTSPWMRFPDNPKAIKRHNELVLSSIPTADLVAELSKRDGVEVYDVDGDFYLRRDGGGYKVRLYKSKILVVRE